MSLRLTFFLILLQITSLGCSNLNQLSGHPKNIILDADNAILYKFPKALQDSRKSFHLLATYFDGNKESLHYFKGQDPSKMTDWILIKKIDWFLITAHQIIELDNGNIWALVSGLRREEVTANRGLYLIQLSQDQEKIIELKSDSDNFVYNASMASDGKKICYTFENHFKNNINIFFNCLNPVTEIFEKEIQVSQNGLNRRPTLAYQADHYYLAWDQWLPSRKPEKTDPNYKINLAVLSNNKITKKYIPLIHGGALNQAPKIQVNKLGEIYIAFHSNHRHALLKHWELAKLVNNKLFIANISNYPLLNDPHEEIQGDEFPNLAISDQGKIAILTRPSHDARLHLFCDKNVVTRALDRDGWGARDIYGEVHFLDESKIWIIRRGHKQILSQVVEDNCQQKFNPEFKKWDGILKSPESIHRILTKTKEKFIYFGDIHTHSANSDGTGASDEVYARLYERGEDFAILTDHDNIVGSKMFPSQFAENISITNWFNYLPDFATLQAFEWTTPVFPRGFGHKNIYFKNLPVNPVYSFRGKHPDTASLFHDLKNKEAFAAPHHTAWTGTDWENHDNSIQRQFEIASVHGVYESDDDNIFKTRALAKGFSARDGIKRNLRFGFLAGSDAHGLLSHHGNGRHVDPWGHGLTGVKLKTLDRESIWEALYNQKNWATTGTKIILLSEVDHNILKYSINSPDSIRNIDIIVNGLVVQSMPGNSRKTYKGNFPLIPFLSIGSNSVYLRVITDGKKENGEAAFSSPIWLEQSNSSFFR